VEFKHEPGGGVYSNSEPEIPDSSKWSSNRDVGKILDPLCIPEIPDSSKWSSNRVYMKKGPLGAFPEIPDSSKWSSNLREDSHGIRSRFLKYQIPVSGVQTYSESNAGRMLSS